MQERYPGAIKAPCGNGFEEIAMNRPRCGCLRANCELTGNAEQITGLENQVANLLHRSVNSASHAGRKQR
jgi:hypothetical protein